MNPTDFDVLTFDCYGTLIDWETGIVAALRPWLAREGLFVGAEEILELFGRCESEQEKETPDMLYSDLLAWVHRKMAAHWGRQSTDEDAAAFGASVADWPAFPDSAEALAYLKEHHRLAVLSNVDRGSFAASNKKLGVAFDAVYTAEDIGSYKPDPANFRYMLEHLPGDLGVEDPKILHVAQSLYHDHAPAKALGLTTAWINRRAGRQGAGATPAVEGVKPDAEFPSLAALVKLHKVCADG